MNTTTTTRWTAGQTAYVYSLASGRTVRCVVEGPSNGGYWVRLVGPSGVLMGLEWRASGELRPTQYRN